MRKSKLVAYQVCVGVTERRRQWCERRVLVESFGKQNRLQQHHDRAFEERGLVTMGGMVRPATKSPTR